MITQYFDIIVLLVVVLVIYTKLKHLLGTRPDGAESTKDAEENAAKIFDLIIKEAEKQNKSVETPAIAETTEKTVNLSETDQALSEIPGFNAEVFISGAKKAFEIIQNAFNEGDVETLEMLVNKNLLKKFQEIIEQRHADGIIAETDFIGFNKAEITSAKVNKNKIAKITVEFISEQVNMLKNATGAVIEGDDKFIQTITDFWTFEKAVTSTNPNWLLVSTKK